MKKKKRYGMNPATKKSMPKELFEVIPYYPIKKQKKRLSPKEYYQLNKPKIISQVVRSRRKRSRLNNLIVIKHKLNNFCVDCKRINNVINNDIFDLTFDHIKGKKLFDISEATSKGYSLNVLLAEIDKCELVCWNHHSLRTQKRSNSYVFRLSKPLKNFKTNKQKQQFIDKLISKERRASNVVIRTRKSN